MRLHINISNLKVAYGKNIALEIQKLEADGRIIGVIGHNGSGKSTLIKTTLGLLTPKTGSLEVRTDRRLIPEKHMAFSPENGAVFEDLDVESYLKLWCRIKLGKANHYKNNKIIETLSITPLLKKLGRELSKGQKRRVQSAVGFLIKPQLFLFDEPFDGLDILQSNELANIIQEQAPKMGMIISSHRMEVIERIADLVIVLKSGKVHTYGSLDEVCTKLCSECFLVSHLPEQYALISDLIPILQKEFCDCLINQIGKQLIIAGNNISIEEIKKFFYQYQVPPIKMDKVRPSLVDAMRYHLNKPH